jgi:hypothetical protein
MGSVGIGARPAREMLVLRQIEKVRVVNARTGSGSRSAVRRGQSPRGVRLRHLGGVKNEALAFDQRPFERGFRAEDVEAFAILPRGIE